VQSVIQSYPKIVPDSDIDDFSSTLFSLIHLNGIAFPKSNSKEFLFDISSFEPDLIFAEYLSNIYENLEKKSYTNNLLKFAWENINSDYSLKQNSTLEKMAKIAEQTEILIINGYSFPIFNRQIDKAIFSKMRQLRKIYIQSPQASEIENIIMNDLLIEAQPQPKFSQVGYWNQFFIPTEWSKDIGTYL